MSAGLRFEKGCAMTIPLDSAISLTMGHAFAIAGGEAISQDPEMEKACLDRGRIFTALVTVPVGSYFLVRWPDWSWMYTVKKRSRSRLLGAIGLSMYLVANEIGFRNAARLIKAGKREEALLHAAGSLGLLSAISLVGFKRLHWIGTREQFEEGTAGSIFKSWQFIASMHLAGMIAVPPALYVLLRNLSENSKSYGRPAGRPG